MRKTEKYDLKKEDLFDKITELITEIGYENITIRGICSHLDISTGTFYHYFNDKNDLIHVLFNDIDSYFRTVVSDSFTDNEADNLVLFFEHYGKYCVKNGVETCKCISAAPFKNNGPAYMADSRGITVTLHDLLARGIEKGQFKTNESLESLTEMIMIMLRGFSADWAKKNASYDIVPELVKGANFIRKALEN